MSVTAIVDRGRDSRESAGIIYAQLYEEELIHGIEIRLAKGMRSPKRGSHILLASSRVEGDGVRDGEAAVVAVLYCFPGRGISG